VPYALRNANDQIQLWEKIEIFVGEGSEAGRYKARIEDFTDQGLVISGPEYISGNTLLRNGIDCAVYLTRPDAIYQFHTRITVHGEGSQRAYQLTSPNDIKRVQRRQFVRIDMSRKLDYAVLPVHVPEEMTPETLTWHESVTVNISGGGMFMRTPHELAPGEVLLLRVYFFSELGLPREIAAICRRVVSHESGQQAGVEFVRAENLSRRLKDRQRLLVPETAAEFDQAAQNRLVNYVFQEQVKLRQKGLL